MPDTTEIPINTHWRNFHIFGWEVALHNAGVRMIGHSTARTLA